MRILFILQVFPKTSEQFILDQIVSLLNRGHDVTILSYLAPADLVPPEVLVPYAVKLYGLFQRTIYFKDEVGTMENLYSFQINPTLRDALSNTDVLLAHFARTPAQIAERLSHFSSRPFVFFSHAFDIFVNPNIDELRHYTKRAAFHFVISAYNKRYLTHMLGSEYAARFRLVRCGVIRSQFKNVHERPPRVGRRVLLVGRLVEKKGIADALEAFSRIISRFPEARLRIVGDGPLRKNLADLSEALGIARSVTWLGLCSHERALQEMEAADVFILPSCTASNGDREGLPVSILEASASGLPVVSTRHSGIPEAVVDGAGGFLTDEHDIDSLVYALQRLLDDASLRQKMGAFGQEYVMEHFNNDRELDRLEALLHKALEPIPNAFSSEDLLEPETS